MTYLSSINATMFEHYDKMNKDFISFLDLVVAGMGWMPIITSDYRSTVEQISLGSAIKSLHELGRAVDIRMPLFTNSKGIKVFDNAKLFLLTESVMLYKRGARVELEFEITPNNTHIHLGLFPKEDTRPSKLLLLCNH